MKPSVDSAVAAPGVAGVPQAGAATRRPRPAQAALGFGAALYFNSAMLVLSTPIFTHTMSAAEFGQVVLYTSWMTVLGVFATLSLSKGVFNNAQIEFEHDIAGYMSAMLGLQIAATAVTLALLLGLCALFGNFTGLTVPLLAFMFANFIATGTVNFWQANERFHYRWRTVLAMTVTTSLIGIGTAALVLPLVPYRVEARVYLVALPAMLCGVVLAIRLWRKARALYVRRYWAYAFGMSITLIPHYAAQALLLQFDRFIVGDVLGRSAVGIYGLAAAIASAVTMLWAAVSAAWTPWLLKRLAAGEHAAVERSAHVVLAGVAAAAITVAFAAPEAVALLSPPSYHDAMYIVPWLALSSYFQFKQSVFLTVQFYAKRARWITACSLAAVALSVGLSVLVVPLWGAPAAAIVSVTTYAALLVMHYLLLQRHGPALPMRAGALGAYAFAAIAAVLLALQTQAQPLLRGLLLLALLAGGAVAIHAQRGRLLAKG